MTTGFQDNHTHGKQQNGGNVHTSEMVLNYLFIYLNKNLNPTCGGQDLSQSVERSTEALTSHDRSTSVDPLSQVFPHLNISPI